MTVSGLASLSSNVNNFPWLCLFLFAAFRFLSSCRTLLTKHNKIVEQIICKIPKKKEIIHTSARIQSKPYIFPSNSIIRNLRCRNCRTVSKGTDFHCFPLPVYLIILIGDNVVRKTRHQSVIFMDK